MKTGDLVVYNESPYKILYIYESGYCELKDENEMYKIILVHKNDIKKNYEVGSSL